MVHYLKNIVLQYLLILSSTLLYAQMLDSHEIPKDYFITTCKEWYICSPVINKDTTYLPELHYQSPYNYLYTLGEQADQAWEKSKKSGVPAIKKYQVIFEPITRDFLVDFIDQIVHDDALLQKIAKASYRNVTGFLKIVLIDSGDSSWKIRLHVWKENEQKEFPHNHKWDFYSKIITGYLLQEIYEADNGQDDILNPFSVREPVSLMPALEDGKLPCPCRDNYSLSQKGADPKTISLQIASRNIIGIGESYCMPHHLIHTITPGRGAISLVFTSKRKTDNSEVYVPLDQVDTDLNRFAPSVTTDELKDELLRIKKVLLSLQIHEKYLPEVVDLRHYYYHMNNNDPILKISEWRQAITEQKNRKRVKQLSNADLKQFTVSANELGKILINNNPIDPLQDYLFTIVDGVTYATLKDFQHQACEIFCHSSFSDYGPVDSAGVLQCDEQGYVTILEAYSGHYAPTVTHMEIAKNHLSALGANINKVKLITYKDRT